MKTQETRAFETRVYPFEIRAVEDSQRGATIEGRPIVYESQTDICGLFSETIAKGALDGADLKDVRFLVNHNTDMIPLARSRNNNERSTMRLSPDKDGLGINVALDVENNADARSLYSAVQRGDISGMSFMFSVADEEWADVDSDYPARTIKAIGRVIEVSAVTFPAYEDTDISARDERALDSARSALDSAREPSEPDGSASDLELEKLKATYLYGI
ncbi:HK97 family phage prohead protease [Raoultibacter timonensis]|uniref:HK97 family phage prohead protease n=1 Tax=Raoultibacter timonensis TaxID=1907662 RepID=UPI0026DBA915|nr:HK97 family phage prohead protease [Raoultibacter timonensis]